MWRDENVYLVPGTHQGALPDSLHGRWGGFYVAGARASCRVVSIAACVLPCDTSNVPLRVSPARTAVLYLVLKRVLHHNKTAAVPYVRLLLFVRTRSQYLLISGVRVLQEKSPQQIS